MHLRRFISNGYGNDGDDGVWGCFIQHPKLFRKPLPYNHRAYATHTHRATDPTNRTHSGFCILCTTHNTIMSLSNGAGGCGFMFLSFQFSAWLRERMLDLSEKPLDPPNFQPFSERYKISFAPWICLYAFSNVLHQNGRMTGNMFHGRRGNGDRLSYRLKMLNEKEIW